MILTGNTKLILSLSGFAILITVGLIAGYINNEHRYHFNEGLFAVGKEWVEITPKRPIKCDLMYQRLVLNILTPYGLELAEIATAVDALLSPRDLALLKAEYA